MKQFFKMLLAVICGVLIVNLLVLSILGGMAGSLAGSGLGLLVLFRTHRRMKDNLLILATVYVFGVVFGHLAGYLI